MRQFFIYLIILGVVLFISCQKKVDTASSFFQGFNLEELVEKTNAIELKPANGSGTVSASHGEKSEYRRSFNLDYSIEEQNDKRFDESKFFDELKVKIAKK